VCVCACVRACVRARARARVCVCACVCVCVVCVCDFIKLQFIGPHHFCRYNMFNHYFFGGDASRSMYLEFLRKCSSVDADNLLVMIDPPFGGHVAVIAFILQCITNDYRNLHQGIYAILSFWSAITTIIIIHFFCEISQLTFSCL